ncbi:MAG: hypothetical protein JXM79_03010, partial [Sedimentisphaerales bacterium]|nr:hypothetical protein [Sedimentisphaerales bacterium]
TPNGGATSCPSYGIFWLRPTGEARGRVELSAANETSGKNTFKDAHFFTKIHINRQIIHQNVVKMKNKSCLFPFDCAQGRRCQFVVSLEKTKPNSVSPQGTPRTQSKKKYDTLSGLCELCGK